MRRGNLIGNILCAFVLCTICVLGLTGCSNSGPNTTDLNSGPAYPTIITVTKKGTGSVTFFFFFQAEDGIRDYKVTGVKTCALPISTPAAQPSDDTSVRWVALDADGTPR